ncbi:MAG: SgcJ/EcaC family oxidoreductase [Rhizobiales bacterium]|nr:SgcJ/EcaC family oxidoreductase [Hyphomicrobiales bacterium]
MSLNLEDVRKMAQRYAKAWSSHVAADVAAFYEPDGSIIINDGEPIVGRAAFAEMAQSFFDGFPDLVITVDAVRTAGNRAVMMWTLEGTNSGPEGSGHKVRFSGWEAWHLSDELKVITSDGRFDVEEYERQCAEGV